MLRADLKAILDWVPRQSEILDLGCGDGALLEQLIKTRNCFGYGLETNPDNIQTCIERNIPVIEQDLNQGLDNFKNQSFDVVIMTQALQVIRNPHLALDAILRVGKEAIVTFPNFGNWKNRLYLSLHGQMPMSKALPYAWYNTPNIHLCTFKDFEKLCLSRRICIMEKTVLDESFEKSSLVDYLPNLLGETALYRITKSSQAEA